MSRALRKKEVLERLKAFGESVYTQMHRGTFPAVRMASRSVQNIDYDPNLRQYVLGDQKVLRSARNVRHLRPLAQLLWAGHVARSLVSQGKTSTLRDLFYMAQADEVHFKDQAESDNIVTDLETITGYAREDFHVFPEERSSIFGDLTIEYTVPGYEGRRLNLMSHPDGLVIGPTLTSAEFVHCNAKRVIVIEKGAMFTRFVEEKAYERFKALLIQTAGQPPRATRRLIRRLNQELGLPVIIFTDGDPWGMHIATVIISGSANAAHLRELTTPDAKWCGVYATDIVNYKLPSDPLTELDVKRLYELKKDPRYEGELWKREIDMFLKIRRKAEQEAFSRYGLTYIVDKYLPDKLKEFAS
ncbi:MAG: DNA topoisomerase IV subunit A [Candidatus Bathyarchaeia archaeon]